MLTPCCVLLVLLGDMSLQGGREGEKTGCDRITQTPHSVEHGPVVEWLALSVTSQRSVRGGKALAGEPHYGYDKYHYRNRKYGVGVG